MLSEINLATTLSTPPFAHKKFFISIIFTMRFIMDKGRGKGFITKISSPFGFEILDKALYKINARFSNTSLLLTLVVFAR